MMDPACGTGGFLLAAYEYISRHHKLDRKQKAFLKTEALHGVEIVESAARLCAMNLLLHGIGEEECPVAREDSLAKQPSSHYDMVLTNPPFGKKSSLTFLNEEGEEARENRAVVREDFWVSTSNKQLNFL